MHANIEGSKGMTLLEAIVVLVLIGILAAVGIPGAARSTASYEIVEEARQVHALLTTARARAIAEQRGHRFVLDSDTYEIQGWVDGTGWVAIGAERSLVEGADATIDGGADGSIEFRPHGRVDAPATIVVADAEHEQTIQVLASGLVRWSGRRL